MYVCLCKGITDSQIRKAVAEGATNLREVRKSLGVSAECGKCRCETRELLRATLASGEATSAYYSAA